MYPTITPRVVANRLACVLNAEYGAVRCWTKQLGRKLRKDPRALENWQAGACTPLLTDALHLAAECDAIAEELFAIIKEIKDAKN